VATDTIRDNLTPDDVTAKTFTAVGRKPEGYDMGEVDQFLDEIVATLKRVAADHEAAQVEAARTSPGLPGSEDGELDRAGSAAANGTVAPRQDAGAAADERPAKPLSASAATSAAVRVLQMAQDEAEQIRAEAQTDADQARARAQNEADALDEQTRTRRAQLLAELEAERNRLGEDVEGLRAFEREYRGRLRTYFEDQIGRLDAERVPQAGAVTDEVDGSEPGDHV